MGWRGLPAESVGHVSQLVPFSCMRLDLTMERRLLWLRV